jgi:hypothetical protein
LGDVIVKLYKKEDQSVQSIWNGIHILIYFEIVPPIRQASSLLKPRYLLVTVFFLNDSTNKAGSLLKQA